MQRQPDTNVTRTTWRLLGLLVVGSGIVGFLMLTRGHNWGDDFAAYLLQAQSIVDGHMDEFIRRSTFAVDASGARYGPVSTPWGFPLMLAPVVAILGLNLLALKVVLTLCYMAFLPAMFLLARNRLTDTESLLLTAVMAFNVTMLRTQNSLLADLPFLLVSTLGLWIMEAYGEEDTGPAGVSHWGVLAGLSVFAGAFLRPNGFLLLLPLAAFQVMGVRKHFSAKGGIEAAARYVLAPYLAFAMCYAAQAIVFPNSSGGLASQFSTFSRQTVLSNLAYYGWLPMGFFEQIITRGSFAYAGLLVFLALGLLALRRQDLPLLLYAAATFALYVVFPLQQTLRYLFPIVPILLIFAFRGMKRAAGWLGPPYRRGGLMVAYVLWGGLAVASLVASLAVARKNLAADRVPDGGWQTGPFSAASAPLFEFIREETPAQSVVIFFKPRAMRLLTDRDSFITADCRALAMGDYVVLVNDEARTDQIRPEEISTCSPDVGLEEVFRERGFIAYEILSSP
jgi:hypothetical protein